MTVLITAADKTFQMENRHDHHKMHADGSRIRCDGCPSLLGFALLNWREPLARQHGRLLTVLIIYFDPSSTGAHINLCLNTIIAFSAFNAIDNNISAFKI